MQRHVTIIGGGVIGLTSAYALVRKGHFVSLIDAHADVASETSHANGGQLSYRYVAPLADSGVPRQTIKWLLAGNTAPLRLRPTLSPAQWHWMAQFLAACNHRTHQTSATQMLSLALHSQQVLGEWRTHDGLEGFAWQQCGKLVIHRDPAALDKAASARIAPQDQQVLDAHQCAALEPSLAAGQTTLAGGIFSASDETADCHAFCQALENRLQASGRYIRIANTCVAPLTARRGRIDSLVLQHDDGRRESHAVEEVIIAAGNHSCGLVRSLGLHLPLQPLKGYSLTLPLSQALPDSAAPCISVTDAARKIVYANLHSCESRLLRVAAMVDIGRRERDGFHPRLDERRIAALRQMANDTFPEAGDFSRAIPWAGLRPSTPKGPPILGRAKQAGAPGNLWLNVGHGSLGFTLSCASGDLIARAISREAPPDTLCDHFPDALAAQSGH